MDKWVTKQFYDGDGNPVYIHCHQRCGYEISGYKEQGTPFCPNCGKPMSFQSGGSQSDTGKVLRPCTTCDHRYWNDPECKDCNGENNYRYYKAMSRGDS